MHDIERRIRDSKPEAGALPEVDVQALVRRAGRRTMATRLSTGLAAVVLVAGAAVTVDQLRPRSSVEIGLVSPATTGQPSAGALGSPDSATPTPTPTSTPVPAQGEILARPTPGEAVEAGPGGPAAPVCATQGAPDGLATIVIGPDVPRPRCRQVLPAQQLQVANDAGETVTAALGAYRFRLDPGEQVTLDLPVSNYLGAGVHRIDSSYGPAQAEVWVLQAPSASLGQQARIDALLEFARDPSDETFARVPLTGTVALGTGEGITVEHAAADLRDPEAWRLDGGVSALAALAGADEQLIFTVGERPSCGSPMPPAPEQLANLTRLAVQPPPDEGCEDWFAVDLYVDDDGTGRIRAVTIDTAP